MIVIDTAPSSGLERLWNDAIASAYDFEDRPEWTVRDDGHREANLRQEAGNELVEMNARFVAADDWDTDETATDAVDAESEDDASDADLDADATAATDSDDDEGVGTDLSPEPLTSESEPNTTSQPNAGETGGPPDAEATDENAADEDTEEDIE